MTHADPPAMQIIVVIPDGLCASEDGTPLPKPSFVYRQLLDYLIPLGAHHHLILAPANDFGTGVYEQEAASRYLVAHGVVAVAPSIPSKTYIDTRGNAAFLRQDLIAKKMWPLPPITLAAAHLHARRARLCFEKEGFIVEKLLAVPYKIPKNEKIVSRLFYYRYPWLHRLYEALAYLRDFIRPANAAPSPSPKDPA